MTVEADAVEVPHLALGPVGGAPDAGDGRDRRRFAFAGRDLEAQPAVRRRVAHVVDHLEARLPAGEIDAAEVDEIGEAVPLLERGADLDDRLAPNLERQVASEGPRGLDRLAELLAERGGERIFRGTLHGLGLRPAHAPPSGRGIFFSNSRRPARSASGPGGHPGT